jgi:hypothetical protein
MDGQRPGIGNSAAFQVSGWPWITGSYVSASIPYVKVELPTVAKSVTVYNRDANSLWPFTLTGSCPLLVFVGRDLTGTYPPNQITRNHFVEIPVSGSYTFDTKCTQVFIAKKSASQFGAFQLSGEMTNCSINDLYAMHGTTPVRDGVLTGSGIDF